MSRTREARTVWRPPLLLGAISAVGLVTALLSDSWGDWVSWATLGAVCAAGASICVRGFARRDRAAIRRAPLDSRS